VIISPGQIFLCGGHFNVTCARPSNEERQYARCIFCERVLVAEATTDTHTCSDAGLLQRLLHDAAGRLKAILLAVPGVHINTRGHDMIDERRQQDQMKVTAATAAAVADAARKAVFAESVIFLPYWLLREAAAVYR